MKSKLALLPLLLILCLAVLSRSSTYSKKLIADESKFYEHAEHITNGYYADPENPNLKEGPGYPLYLALSAALDLPYALSRITNILFLFSAFWYLYQILQRYIGRKPALILTYLMAIYPPMLRWANLMYAESLTLLLLMGFCFHFIHYYLKEGNIRRHLILSMLFLGYMALTKIIFAYVIIVGLIICLLIMLIPKINSVFRLKRTMLVFAGALIFFSPYLAYSYHITDKFFYLGMHGGRILYFRSTPFENEFGNSFNEAKILQEKGPDSRKEVNVNTDILKENHGELFASISELSYQEKDSVLKKKAIENMKKYPVKYLKNTVANTSRIFFHFPFSYRIQNLETLGYLIPNMFIIALVILGIYPAVIRRNLIPKELIIILIFSLIYLGGHILLGGRGRFLIPVVPLWMVFFGFIYFRILQIRIKDSISIGNKN